MLDYDPAGRDVLLMVEFLRRDLVTARSLGYRVQGIGLGETPYAALCWLLAETFAGGRTLGGYGLTARPSPRHETFHLDILTLWGQPVWPLPAEVGAGVLTADLLDPDGAPDLRTWDWLYMYRPGLN